MNNHKKYVQFKPQKYFHAITNNLCLRDIIETTFVTIILKFNLSVCLRWNVIHFKLWNQKSEGFNNYNITIFNNDILKYVQNSNAKLHRRKGKPHQHLWTNYKRGKVFVTKSVQFRDLAKMAVACCHTKQLYKQIICETCMLNLKYLYFCL